MPPVGYVLGIQSTGGIGMTTPSVPSVLQTSSAGEEVTPTNVERPTHGRRIGSLSWKLVGCAMTPTAVDGSGLLPQVPGGGTLWVPSPCSTPPGPTNCLF